MRLALTGRNLDITPALRQLVTRRLAKLDRLLHDGIISAQVVLRLEKHRHKTDVLLNTRGDASPGSVLAFRDPSLDRVRVLVRRADGALGLLDPDV